MNEKRHGSVMVGLQLRYFVTLQTYRYNCSKCCCSRSILKQQHDKQNTSDDGWTKQNKSQILQINVWIKKCNCALVHWIIIITAEAVKDVMLMGLLLVRGCVKMKVRRFTCGNDREVGTVGQPFISGAVFKTQYS